MIDVKDIDAIIGAEVMDTANDRIGRVSQVYIDSEDQHPSWVSVRTGFFGRSETLIPIDDARWESSTLFVQVDRAKVREAPHVDPDQELSVEEQTALYRYYGKGRVDDAQDVPAGGGAAGEDRPASQTDDEPAAAAAAEQPSAAEAAPTQAAVEEQPRVEGASEQDRPEQARSGQESADQDVQDRDVPAEDAPQPVSAVADAAAAVQDDGLSDTEAERGADESVAAADAGATSESQRELVVPEASADEAPEAEQTAEAAADAHDEAEPAAEETPQDASAAAPESPELVRHRSNYVQPPEGEAESGPADGAAPTEPEVLTRYEERLRIATERVPATRIRLVKRIVTEHRTVSVPVSHEELHLERETIGEEEIAAWEGPVSELQEEEREIVLMAERPVVSTHTAPIERIRLVREVVSGTHDVEADLRHEQFDLDRGENGEA